MKSRKSWQEFAGRAIFVIGGCRGSREALSEACASWDPRAAGGFAYKSKDFSRYGGATTSLGLVYFGQEPGDTRWIIIDQGTGVISLSRDFILPNIKMVRQWVGDQPLDVTCLQTHFHRDHVSGVTFNQVFYQPGINLTFYSPNLRLYKSRKSGTSTFSDLPATEKMMREAFSEDQFPVDYEFLRAKIKHEQFTVGKELRLANDLSIHTHPLYHPGGCSGYRICKNGYQSFLCMTDCDLGSDPNINNVIWWMNTSDDNPIMYVDVQLDDEQYDGVKPTGDGLRMPRGRINDDPGWGHNCPRNVFNALQQCKYQPSKVIWGHHDPNNDDATLDLFRESIWDQAQTAGFDTKMFLEARDSGKIRIELQKLP